MELTPIGPSLYQKTTATRHPQHLLSEDQQKTPNPRMKVNLSESFPPSFLSDHPPSFKPWIHHHHPKPNPKTTSMLHPPETEATKTEYPPDSGRPCTTPVAAQAVATWPEPDPFTTFTKTPHSRTMPWVYKTKSGKHELNIENSLTMHKAILLTTVTADQPETGCQLNGIGHLAWGIWELHQHVTIEDSRAPKTLSILSSQFV